MLSTANQSGVFKPRIVHTSSSAAYLTSTINFNALADGPIRNKVANFNFYNYSKLGNILFSNELARRYGDQGIVSVSLNPGNMDTDLLRNMPVERFIFKHLLLYPAAQGALTQLWAGTTTEGNEMNGKYLIPWARFGEQYPPAEDPKLATDFWVWCEEQIAKFKRSWGA